MKGSRNVWIYLEVFETVTYLPFQFSGNMWIQNPFEIIRQWSKTWSVEPAEHKQWDINASIINNKLNNDWLDLMSA